MTMTHKALAILRAVGFAVSQTFRVADWAVESIEAEIAKLAKRAAKLGCEAPRVVVLAEIETEHVRDGYGNLTGQVRTWRFVRIEGKGPTLNGWSFIGTIATDPAIAGHMVRAVPGESIPREWYDHENIDPRYCDHCQKIRRRNDTFLVRHESGEIRQVGRQCIKDFLGYHDATRLARYLSDVYSLLGRCAGEDEESYGGWGHGPVLFDLTKFLWAVVLVCKVDGWVSKAMARDAYPPKSATASTASWLLMPAHNADDRRAKDGYRGQADGTEERMVQDILAWLPGWLDDGEWNDYRENVHVATETGLVSPRTSGIVASIVGVYNREQERFAKERAAAKERTNEYYGEIKKRYKSVRCTVLGLRWIEGYYGSTQIVKLRTEPDGHTLTWFSSSGINASAASAEDEDQVEVGDTIVVDFTVKSHEVYTPREGASYKQTKITRAKVVSIEKDPEMAKKRAAAAKMEAEHAEAKRQGQAAGQRWRVSEATTNAIHQTAALATAKDKSPEWQTIISEAIRDAMVQSIREAMKHGPAWYPPPNIPTWAILHPRESVKELAKWGFQPEAITEMNGVYTVLSKLSTFDPDIHNVEKEVA